MERGINQLAGVTNATLTFATKQLRVTGKNPDSLLEDMQKICSSIESEVKLVPRDNRPKSNDVLKVDEILPGARDTKPLFEFSERTKTILGIALGAVLFIAGEILDSVENAAASKPKIDRFITKFARVYTPFVVILAACTAVIPSLFTGNWNYAVCPEFYPNLI